MVIVYYWIILRVLAKKGTEVIIITNIPKRWTHYKYGNGIVEARKAISSYIKMLNPLNYSYKLSVYFNFDNHAKIIITDHLVYCGSSNFSDASKNNYECGFISDDQKIIQHIKNEIFPPIIDQSVPYYNFDCIKAIAFLNDALMFCEEAKTVIFDAAYEPWEDYDTNFKTVWIYRTNNSGISAKLLSDILEGFKQYESALAIIGEIVNSYYDEYDELPEDVKCLEQLYDNYDKDYEKMLEKIETLFWDIDHLSHYNYGYEVNNIINNDYGMEAFDENLDRYVDLALSEASIVYENLIKDAKPTINSILKEFDGMIEYYDKMQDTLKNMLKINSRIDNTQ